MDANRTYIHMARKECFSYPGILGGCVENRLDLFLEIDLVKFLSVCGAVKVVVEYWREIVGTFEIRGT